MEDNRRAFHGSFNIYGEDSEAGLGRLLWDFSDDVNETSQRATCSTYCGDSVHIPMPQLMAGVFLGKRLDTVSDFHKHIYQAYVGSPAGSLDQTGPVDGSATQKMLAIGAIFFGVWPCAPLKPAG